MSYVACSRQQKQADTLSKIREHFLDHAHLHETNMDSQLQNFLHDGKDRLFAHTNRLRDSRMLSVKCKGTFGHRHLVLAHINYFDLYWLQDKWYLN